MRLTRQSTVNRFHGEPGIPFVPRAALAIRRLPDQDPTRDNLHRHPGAGCGEGVAEAETGAAARGAEEVALTE